MVYKKGDLRFLPGTEAFQFPKNTGCPGKYGASGNVATLLNQVLNGLEQFSYLTAEFRILCIRYLTDNIVWVNNK